uniref:EO6b n=1 Tax=Barramundi adomavirus TaxID=2609870 RepID=A0A6F9F5G6_9VIRU|nr:TPA_asm: EO6b [Barramundi adomavirus]
MSFSSTFFLVRNFCTWMRCRWSLTTINRAHKKFLRRKRWWCRRFRQITELCSLSCWAIIIFYLCLCFTVSTLHEYGKITMNVKCAIIKLYSCCGRWCRMMIIHDVPFPVACQTLNRALSCSRGIFWK